MNDLTKGTIMQNPVWVQVTDWTKVQRGDTVRLTNDDGAEATIVVKDRRDPFYPKTSPPWVTSASGFEYRLNVWRLFVKAPSRPALPAVPGTIIRAKGHGISAMLGYVSSEWFCIGGNRPLTDLEIRKSFESGFDVLEPVAETAEKVLDRVFGMILGGASPLAATERLRAEFGVSS